MLPTVTIGPHTFNVFLVPKNQSDDCGHVNFETLEIFIRNDLPKSLQEETLIHEILHIVRWLLALEVEEKETEEKLVQAQAQLLYQVLKYNKIDFS
jgi:hypothetical protein